MPSSKLDHVRNSIFTLSRVNFALLLEGGMNLIELSELVKECQECITAASRISIVDAGHSIEPPSLDTDSNPFDQ